MNDPSIGTNLRHHSTGIWRVVGIDHGKVVIEKQDMSDYPYEQRVAVWPDYLRRNFTEAKP